jgi:WD40 repeat protein
MNVAVSGDYLFSGSSDKTIKQWSISSGSLIRTFVHGSFVNSVAVSGDYLFSGSSDSTIKQWSISSGSFYPNTESNTESNTTNTDSLFFLFFLALIPIGVIILKFKGQGRITSSQLNLNPKNNNIELEASALRRTQYFQCPPIVESLD